MIYSLAGETTNDDVRWPSYTDKLDYELELAVVVGTSGRNVSPEDADEYVAGYTIFDEKIVRACEYAGEYPVMFERDNAWTQFTEYAEALLDFFEDGLYTKTEHCLPEMQRYQRHMEEKADDASYF